jgi:glutamate synthase (NADPH/NADH) large chain
MMMLIPEAWAGNPLMDEDRRAFYEYHGALMEPWDGPAAIAFSDGRQIGATLDRNGPAPARYLVTDDGLVVLASRRACCRSRRSRSSRSGGCSPGKMLLIDLEKGRIVADDELKRELSAPIPTRSGCAAPRSCWRI